MVVMDSGRVLRTPRNDGRRNSFPRHCERKRSNPCRGKTSVDCFVAIAPRNDDHPNTVIPGRAALARARNPYSRWWLWIPGSCFARPGMTDGEILFPVIASVSEAIHVAARQVWIASSLSLLAMTDGEIFSRRRRDPLAPRNDEFESKTARRANHF